MSACAHFSMRSASIIAFVWYLAILCRITVTGLCSTKASLPIQKLSLKCRRNSFLPTDLKMGRDFNDSVDILSKDDSFLKTSSAMFLVSCPLGMLLDNQHGLFGVLNYAAVGNPINLFLGSHEVLRSAVWVPFLFGFAGFAMSTILFALDRTISSKDTTTLNPSWSKVLYGISFFSAQYYLSGLLDYSGVDNPLIHVILAATAIIGFALFDTSTAGILLGVATAVAGPVAEIFLINVPHLYTYTHADFAGVCSWIPWVYLLGAPAVGNLSRKLYSEFAAPP